MSTNTKLAEALRRELRRRKVHSLPAKLRLMEELGLDDITLTEQWMIGAARDFEAAATEFLAAHDAEQAAQAVPAGYECVTLRAGDYGWRYAVRQSAKLLRNIAEGRHSVRNPGRFVAAKPERVSAPRGNGSELARAWGLMA